MSPPRIAVALIALAGLSLLAGAGTSARSSAAFTSQSANPSNAFSTAETFCSSSGTRTVDAARDAHVDQGTPTRNQGGATNLDVLSRKGANVRALVGFTLPDRADGCIPTAAVLKLTAASAVGGRSLQALRIDPSSSWSETDVTWATQPPTTGSAATAPSAVGVVAWDVTAAVRAMYAEARADGGFLIRDAVEDTPGKTLQSFRSREAAADRPVIEVTFG